jgi:hypothetical protein
MAKGLMARGWISSPGGKARGKDTTRKTETWVDNIKMDLGGIG